ncbi:uncharacterized protein LOC131299518 [Rhododendron vialii]|uniref:uncharacterized protein LOC131299518 n=1 Tax=Rhododendron vialii TaxID=182163 RepID=UPI00265E8732|nr:uncharacterized protein LOC131299518 [Rhododendron vialii]
MPINRLVNLIVKSMSRVRESDEKNTNNGLLQELNARFLEANIELLLHVFPSGHYEPLEESLPGDGFEALAASADDPHWTLSFEGAAGNGTGGAGIVLRNEEGEKFHLAYKLSFPRSNNEAEYEALILGLLAARERGIKHLKIVGDSKLVILQTEGVYALKEPILAPISNNSAKTDKVL